MLIESYNMNMIHRSVKYGNLKYNKLN